MFPGKTYMCPFYHQLQKNTCIFFSLLIQIIRIVPFPLSVPCPWIPAHVTASTEADFLKVKSGSSQVPLAQGLTSPGATLLPVGGHPSPCRWPFPSVHGPGGFLIHLADQAWSLSACGALWRRRKGVFRRRCQLTHRQRYSVLPRSSLSLCKLLSFPYLSTSVFFRSVSHDQRSTLVSCLSSSSSSPSIISLFCC